MMSQANPTPKSDYFFKAGPLTEGELGAKAWVSKNFADPEPALWRAGYSSPAAGFANGSSSITSLGAALASVFGRALDAHTRLALKIAQRRKASSPSPVRRSGAPEI